MYLTRSWAPLFEGNSFKTLKLLRVVWVCFGLEEKGNVLNCIYSKLFFKINFKHPTHKTFPFAKRHKISDPQMFFFSFFYPSKIAIMPIITHFLLSLPLAFQIPIPLSTLLLSLLYCFVSHE